MGLALGLIGVVALVGLAAFLTRSPSAPARASASLWGTNSRADPGRWPPRPVALSPDGRRMYVANATSGTVSVLEVATNAVTASILVATVRRIWWSVRMDPGCMWPPTARPR
jgi:YVTN family beta-propeller protein